MRMVLAGVVEDVWEAEAEPEELYIIFSCNIFFLSFISTGVIFNIFPISIAQVLKMCLV